MQFRVGRSNLEALEEEFSELNDQRHDDPNLPLLVAFDNDPSSFLETADANHDVVVFWFDLVSLLQLLTKDHSLVDLLH